MDCQPVSCDALCIAFKHSMGPVNCDPCQDLGGDISDCDISTGLDNLFHSIGPNLSRIGHEDYRCFYIKNVDGTSTLRNTIVYLGGTGVGTPGKKGGSYVAIGVKLQDEIQQVIVAGANPPNAGEYFEIQVPGYSPNFKVFYDFNITKWLGNFQTAIHAVEGLADVIVTSTGTVPNVTFTINFIGQAAKHQIDLVIVSSNTLTGCTVNPFPVQDGSPVNTVAEIIPDEITAPVGVTFDYYFKGNPIRVGDLLPGEYLPIWIRRTLPIVETPYGAMARPGQMAKLLDNFQIVVDATSP